MLLHRGKTRSGGALLWSLATIAIIALWGGLWWWVKYGAAPEEFDPDRPRRFKVKPSEMAEGVHVHSKGVIRVVAGDVEIHVRPRPDSTPDMYAFAINTQTWLTPEQDEFRKVGRKISAGGKFVEALAISPEQVNQARQLRLETDLILTDEDKARLVATFRKWKETRGEAHKEAEAALLTTAKEVGDRAIAASKQTLIKEIEQVPALLTPEQWKGYADLKLNK